MKYYAVYFGIFLLLLLFVYSTIEKFEDIKPPLNRTLINSNYMKDNQFKQITFDVAIP